MMSNLVKDNVKFLFYFLVLLAAVFVNVFIFVNPAEKPLYELKFVEYVDDDWVEKLHSKIQWYFEDWNDTGIFTHQVAHCKAQCHDDVNETHFTYYDPDCRTHPVYVYDEIVAREKLGNMTYAESTIPCFLKLGHSKIPGANRGIFTKHHIPTGMMFGPYDGVILSDYGEEGDRARAGGYAWKIRRTTPEGEPNDFNIDGVSENSSNWLRWVNSARYEEEQNMMPLLFNMTVYYITYKDIEPDTELLIWYGTNYAQNVLHIFTMKGSGHDWNNDFAPKVDIVICPTCPQTEGEFETGKEEPEAESENSEQEEEPDHHDEDLVHHDSEEENNELHLENDESEKDTVKLT